MERNPIKPVFFVELPGPEEKPEGEDEKQPLHAGDLCPICGSEYLDYDGLLNLACPKCGYALGGCFT